jgi:hypothetical protein
MNYKLHYGDTPLQILTDPDRARYNIIFTFDRRNQLFAVIPESDAVILKLKFPHIILTPIEE